MTQGPVSSGEPDADVPAKVAAALERIARATAVLDRREARAHGLSSVQLRVLLQLVAGPPERRRPGALAREFDVSAASMSDSIAALERKGMLRRERAGNDGRGVALRATVRGRRLTERMRAVTRPVEDAVADLPAGEQVALMRSLFAVIADLRRQGAVTVARMCVTCAHFRPGVRDGRRPHHCALLDMRLGESDLRADCAEHELAA